MQKNFYIFLFIIGIIASAVAPLNAQGWLNNWNYRCEVQISNPGTVLTEYQVRINLNNPAIFTSAKIDGSDLRITSSDGITEIPFWIESWNAAGSQATIWVKVPNIQVGGTNIYLYYGNTAATSVSNGTNTFEFFDDFSSSITVSPGYYNFGQASTIMVRETAWDEGSAPHTLSVVKAPIVGAYNNYIYYGYYGPQASGYIGIAGSNDLVTWTRFPFNPPPATGINNPIFVDNAVRWPSVFLDETNNKYYMVHTMNYGSSYIVYRESTDGLTWTAPTTIVPYDVSNQNPSLFHDPVSGKYYLYWFRKANGYSIMAREANTVAELVSAPNVELLRSSTTLAAPQVLYYDNTYFLSTEILEGVWKVRIYSGTSPLGPFTILPGNPVLSDGCACLFQHLFNGNIYEYYCKETSGTWTLDMRVVDPSTGRIMYEQVQIDETKWTPDGGNWNVTSAMQPNGIQGHVAIGNTSSRQILKSSFTGTDYILEGYGKQISSVVWGFGIRTTDYRNTYSLNLYDNHDETDNYYFYRWSAGSAIEVWKTPLGTINPNTWYKLMIKAHSNNFDIYFNDIFRATTTNNSFSSGSIALYGESGTVAQFDDVRVRKYTSSEPTTTVNDPLPVELSSFSASVIGSSVKLNWRTETEVNNYGFEVERKVGSGQSSVGNYEKIGFVNGNGNSNSPKNYSYEDNGLTPGKYSYRLKQIDNDGQFEYSKTIEVDFYSPKIFELSQNYPNPFNPKTSIRFSLPETGNVKITLYNPLGQEVGTILNETRESGTHIINFDASELNSGMYIYKLESGSFIQTRKMILLK